MAGYGWVCVWVLVRMELLGELAISSLELLLCGLFAHTEDLTAD